MLHLIVNWPWMRSFGDVRYDTRSAPRHGVDGKATVEQRHPFTHGEKAEPVAVGHRAARVEAVAVVLHHERRHRVGLGDVDDRRPRPRMLAHIGQCLLNKPEDYTTRPQPRTLAGRSESVRQLRGIAPAQVPGVKTSFCQGIGGMFAAAGTIIFGNERPN